MPWPLWADSVRFTQLREQRLIYRCSGQPNQEDFIHVLSRGGRRSSRTTATARPRSLSEPNRSIGCLLQGT